MLAVSMSPPVAHYPAAPKRPKLSLKTSELPITYGTSSRGLATIATPSAAVTPTTLNTFNNTFELTHRPSPTSAAASPSLLRSTSGRDRLSRSQSPHPRRNDTVYTVNLPYGVKPILKNTPFPRVRTNSISASPRSSTRRVFFPAPKKVTFGTSLEEEVITKNYVARHSDLFDQEPEPEVPREDEKSDDTDSEESSESSTEPQKASSIATSTPTRPKLGLSNLGLITTTVSAEPVATTSEVDPTSVHTPVSSRKRRRWEWTLGPLPIPQPEQTQEELESEAQSHNEQTWTPASEASTPLTSATTGQDSASSSESEGAKIIKIAPPRPRLRWSPQPPHRGHQLIETSATQAKSSSSSSLPSSPRSLTISSTSIQKRAGSLDMSPRKRKAECLDTSTLGNKSAIDLDRESGDADIEDKSDAGRTGVKRRERAATL